MNYYELLEVSPKASLAVIRAAYKSLMQRYHPDKNRDDPKLAEMATLLVQAFEVLSDEGRRAAYDAKLRQGERERQSRRQAAARGRTSSPRNGKPGKLALLLAAVLLAVSAAWLAGSVEQAIVAEPPRAAAAASSPRRADLRHIASFITDLNVVLRDRDVAEDRNRVLIVPRVAVRVGPRDPDAAIRHLSNMADSIAERLQHDLAGASFSELLKADGEQYLATLILTSMIAATGNGENHVAAAPDEPGDYGPVEVTLPQSFSVR